MTNENNAGRPHATMPISEDSGLPLYRAAPNVRFMWTSLFTNLGTGIQFSLSTANRGDLDVMAVELLDSPEIDTAKVYEVAILKRAEYDALAATAAQPIAPAADVNTQTCTCPSGDGSLRHPCPMHPAADVSAPTDERAITAAMTEGNNHGVKSTVAARIVAAYLNAARAAAPSVDPTIPADLPVYRTAIVPSEAPCAALQLDGGISMPLVLARAAAPVSGQGAQEPLFSITASLREYARNPGYSHGDYADTMLQAALVIDRQDERIDFLEYQVKSLDSRPRSEDSRAKVLNEAAIVVENWLATELDRYFVADAIRALASSAAPDAKEALRTEVQLRGHIHMLNDEIEALKEGAAPKSSGESADAGGLDAERLETLVCEYGNVPVVDSNKRGLRLRKHVMADILTLVQTPAPAAHSSAPSEAVRKFLTDCAATSGGMVNGNNLARYAKRLLDAAPTGESLPVQGVPEGVTYEADDGTVSARRDGELVWHAHIYDNSGSDEAEIAKQVVAVLAAAPTGASK